MGTERSEGDTAHHAGGVPVDHLQRLARAAVPLATPDEPDDLLAQATTVFGWAMVGAVLFHMGWWAFAGG